MILEMKHKKQRKRSQTHLGWSCGWVDVDGWEQPRWSVEHVKG